MGSSIRQHAYASYVIDTTIGDCPKLDLTSYAGGRIHFPSTWTTDTVTFHEEMPITKDTFSVPKKEDNSTTVTIASAVASQSYLIPEALFAAGVVKMVCGLGANDGKVLELTLKG